MIRKLAAALLAFGPCGVLLTPPQLFGQNEPVLPAEVKVVSLASVSRAQTGGKPGPKDQTQCTRREGLIYGRRENLDLTMDVFSPKGKKNGAGVIVCVSAEYKSSRQMLDLLHPKLTTPFLDRGYVVFAVMHSSQPGSTVSDALEDIHRAVRFIKANAKDYDVDPAKLGITGGSAGGQLSLMMGCAGKGGDPASKDPLERETSNVAAVACFFPPTDFLALDGSCPKEISAPFDFREFEPASGKLVPVTPSRRLEIGREISPLTHAGKGSAPTLIIHGDQDKLVPVSQSQAFIRKLEDAGVKSELMVKKGCGHLWLGMEKDVLHFADWFDRHLLEKKEAPGVQQVLR